MQALSGIQPRHSRTVILAAVGLLAALGVMLLSRPAGAATPTSCPGFRVLHNDRIGAAVFPAGTYTVNLEGEGLNCKSSAELFARFLEDFDGILPKPWKVAGEASGKAAFLRGVEAGFSVELSAKAKEEGGSSP